MKINPSIKEIMSDRLVTLHPKDKMSKAKIIFKNNDIHHIPVTIAGRLVGIVSMGDILYREWEAKNAKNKFTQVSVGEFCTIENVMTADPIIIEQSMGLNEALKIMLDLKINALPVVENENLVGILTSHDILVFIKNKIYQNESLSI